MSHNVYVLDNGKDSMGYVGQVPWHGLGQKLSEGADIDTWVAEAGLEWRIEEAIPLFMDEDDDVHHFGEHKILYRSDNKEPLQMVHDIYKPVQPREVVEFYRDLVEAGGMALETAGSLRGGRIVWALARMDKSFNVYDKSDNNALLDPVNMYALLATSFDRSLSSTGRLTSVRVVCNNTLDMAYSGGKNIVKVSHRTRFNEDKKDEVRKEMGLVYADIEERETEIKSMATASLSKEDAIGFFVTMLSKNNGDGTLDVSDVSIKSVESLYTAYKSAPGSNLPTAKDTLWGAVNAVTYSVDHNPNARSDESRLNNAWFGSGRAKKSDAYKLAQDVISEKVSTKLLDHVIEKSEGSDVDDLTTNLKLVVNG